MQWREGGENQYRGQSLGTGKRSHQTLSAVPSGTSNGGFRGVEQSDQEAAEGDSRYCDDVENGVPWSLTYCPTGGLTDEQIEILEGKLK